MIPEFGSAGTLPPGVHWASWQEIVERFGATTYRQELLEGLKRALDVLRIAGCRTVYLDGSFVTDTLVPNDFDACWVTDGVEPELLDAELLDFSNRRRAQKLRYGGDLLAISHRQIARTQSLLTFFQTNRDTGTAKGIIAIDLRILP